MWHHNGGRKGYVRSDVQKYARSCCCGLSGLRMATRRSGRWFGHELRIFFDPSDHGIRFVTDLRIVWA